MSMNRREALRTMALTSAALAGGQIVAEHRFQTFLAPYTCWFSSHARLTCGSNAASRCRRAGRFVGLARRPACR